jgi:hypothetical protein
VISANAGVMHVWDTGACASIRCYCLNSVQPLGGHVTGTCIADAILSNQISSSIPKLDAFDVFKIL